MTSRSAPAKAWSPSAAARATATDKSRSTPGARTALDAWLGRRSALPGNDNPALLLSLQGQRLSCRAIDLTVRRLAQHADLEASAHTLRHTYLTRLVRAGNDIVLVAELAGHAGLKTTRRYSLPSAADLQAAMDALPADY